MPTLPPQRLLYRPALLALALALTACGNTPKVEKLSMDVPASFKEAALFQKANPGAAEVPDAWWELFNDPVLSALEQRVPTANQTVQAAAAAINVARAALENSQVNLFPTVNVTAGATRAASVATVPQGTSYSLQGGLSNWEIDLWNQLGYGVLAARQSLYASQATHAMTVLSTQATLAQTYFSLRTYEAQIRLLEDTVTAYEKSLQLTRNRYRGGVAVSTDVAQAETQLEAAQAQLAESRLQRGLLEHALAVLVGEPPAAFTLGPALPGWLPAPPVAPTQLPSTLLQRRPDIAAAERQVAAANATIGADDAAFFPVLGLSASGGLRHNSLSGLLQSINKFWSLGPTLVLAGLDGGLRQAASDSARGSYYQTVANYKQTVLTALQEVEDNMLTVVQLQTEMERQQASLTAAKKTLEVTQNQYRAGTVSYLNVVTAQATALSTEQALLTLRNRYLTATGILLKNLGGRWEAPKDAAGTKPPSQLGVLTEELQKHLPGAKPAAP